MTQLKLIMAKKSRWTKKINIKRKKSVLRRFFKLKRQSYSFGRVELGSPETMVPVADNFSNFSPQKANRRRFSNPTASTTAVSQSRLQEKEGNKITADVRDSPDEIYGIVHEAPPKEKSISPDNTVQVRDPAKEIFGLLRDRDSQRYHHQPNVYGTVRTHAPIKNDKPNGYLDTLQQKLFGRNPGSSDSSEVYGKVRQYHSETPPSSFETVRGMISNKNNNHNHHHSNHHQHTSNQGDSAGLFDVVRDRVLNSRQRNSNLASSESYNSDNSIKSLRRKNSRKRRRNVSWNFYNLK